MLRPVTVIGHRVALVLSRMRRAQRPADDDLVSFGNLIFDREVQVRKCRVESCHALLVLCQTVDNGGRITESDVCCDQFVRHGWVATIAPSSK